MIALVPVHCFSITFLIGPNDTFLKNIKMMHTVCHRHKYAPDFPASLLHDEVRRQYVVSACYKRQKCVTVMFMQNFLH